MGQAGFYKNGAVCTGCNACQIACKDNHDLPLGVNIRSIRAEERMENGSVRVQFHPVACRHCANALCAGVCPTGALYAHVDGTVGYDRARCTGCGKCARVCPFHQIFQPVPGGRIYKCDGCYDRRLQGKNPVCVDACPVHYLGFKNGLSREEGTKQ